MLGLFRNNDAFVGPVCIPQMIDERVDSVDSGFMRSYFMNSSLIPADVESRGFDAVSLDAERFFAQHERVLLYTGYDRRWYRLHSEYSTLEFIFGSLIGSRVVLDRNPYVSDVHDFSFAGNLRRKVASLPYFLSSSSEIGEECKGLAFSFQYEGSEYYYYFMGDSFGEIPMPQFVPEVL